MLTRENTTAVRGMTAFLMVFVHLLGISTPKSPLLSVSPLGYLLVGVFYFYSGYTLIRGFVHHGIRPSFPVDRLSRVYLPFVVGQIPFALLLAVRGVIPGTAASFLAHISGLQMTNMTLWYIPCIMGLYLSFWCFFGLLGRIRGGRPCGPAMLTVFSLLTAAGYTAICLLLEKVIGNAYAFGALMPIPLLMGLLWAVFDEPVGRFLARHKVPAAVLFLFVTYACCYCTGQGAQKPLFTFFGRTAELYRWIAPGAFAAAVNTLILGEKIESRAAAFLGRYSLEIYIMAYFFAQLLRGKDFYLGSDYLYVAAVGVCAVAGGVLLSVICDLLRKPFSRRQKNP